MRFLTNLLVLGFTYSGLILFSHVLVFGQDEIKSQAEKIHFRGLPPDKAPRDSSYLGDADGLRYYLLGSGGNSPAEIARDLRFTNEMELSDIQREKLAELCVILKDHGWKREGVPRLYVALGVDPIYQSIQNVPDITETKQWEDFCALYESLVWPYERKQIAEILIPTQVERLAQILNRLAILERAGPDDMLGLRTAKAKELFALTKDQDQLLEQSLKQASVEIEEAEKALKQRITEIRNETKRKMWEKLSPEQKKKYEFLTGLRLDNSQRQRDAQE